MNQEARLLDLHEQLPPTGAPERFWRSYWPAILLAAAGVCALSCDLRLALWSRDHLFPRLLYQLVEAVVPYGHGIGVAIILLTVWLLCPERRRTFPRIVSMSVGAGLAANLLKLFIHRTRPGHFDFVGDVTNTFKSWAPLTWNSSAGQSCPSSHTATAMGMTLALAWLFPRGRWLFLGLCTLVAAHRVMNSAHFLSDVCWGASLGWIVGVTCLRKIFGVSWFDRFEQRGPARSEPVAPSASEHRRAA